MAVPFLFARLIPKEFQPLLSAVSPVAFSVVEWKQILKDAPTLVRRWAERDGVEDLKESLGTHWKSQGKSPAIGDAALELYFAQIFNPKGLFLDLRRRHFSIDKNDSVSFTPNGFWVKWSESFREGLLDIYTGYYGDSPEQIDNGLRLIGLINENMTNDDRIEVKNMLLGHIGGDYRQQRFLVSDFTSSFERFFKFLVQKKIRLGADFLYLGIYLASLYQCLQEEGGVYDVKSCFQTVKNDNERHSD